MGKTVLAPPRRSIMPTTKSAISIGVTLSLCAMFIQGSGWESSSALRYGEKRPMPPQMVDYSLYEDVIELEPEEKKDYLNFSGSELKPIVRVKVSCRCETKRDRFAPEMKYQELWFRSGSPIGCKHHIEFPIKERHKIGIFVKSNCSNMNDAEIAALASALVRLRLEASLNRNQIATVRVPSYAFPRLKCELEKQNFVSFRENSQSFTSLIPLPLETEFGTREVMAFLKRPR